MGRAGVVMLIAKIPRDDQKSKSLLNGYLQQTLYYALHSSSLDFNEIREFVAGNAFWDSILPK